MKAARNQKELEKMIMDQVKKKIPSVTKDYCHKWYATHGEIAEIVSEDKFIQIVNDTMKISIKSGRANVEFEIFKSKDIDKEKYEQMKMLWDDFKSDYASAVIPKIFNQK